MAVGYSVNTDYLEPLGVNAEWSICCAVNFARQVNYRQTPFTIDPEEFTIHQPVNRQFAAQSILNSKSITGKHHSPLTRRDSPFTNQLIVNLLRSQFCITSQLLATSFTIDPKGFTIDQPVNHQFAAQSILNSKSITGKHHSPLTRRDSPLTNQLIVNLLRSQFCVTSQLLATIIHH
ncbi:hypothetical protein [uncultured Chryseobacterium sp.]|uniref:hypothetical protein n=1 Tax=uncultured Chryseobacterium sp. TaxID=259322 RepID=UPI0025F85BFD|nr:hypothetical protein [uncultured Chryseobacterium sp.]